MFAHLHTHLLGSYSDSVLRFEEAAEKAARIGQRSLAMTEHGEMPFAYEFSDACRRHGIHPVFGVEGYFVEDAALAVEKKDNQRYHLLLLAKDDAGYRNLCGLVSDSWLKNSYLGRRGQIDWKLLEARRDGLICLSACFFNPVSQFYMKQSAEKGEETFRRLLGLFGKDFYVELGFHGVPEEDLSNKLLVDLAGRYKVPVTVTNDSHYLEPQDWMVHDTIIKTRWEGKVTNFKLDSQQYWLRSEDEMRSLGTQQRWLDLSEDIAKQCQVKLPEAGPARGSGKMLSLMEIDDAIKSGHAAYLVEPVVIDEAKAREHVARTLGDASPQKDWAVKRIAGIPRRTVLNPKKIAYWSDGPIGELVPLKIQDGKPAVEMPEADAVRAGCQVMPAVPSPLAQAFESVRGKLAQLFKG